MKTLSLIALVSTAPWAAAGASDELPVLVRSFAEVEKPAPPFEDRVFKPRQGETIAFLGGTDTFNLQRLGYFEALIHLAWPEHQLKIRNLGWQGDTIYHQARPRFFYTKVGDPQPGSSADTRRRTEPGTIVITFGKIESLEGTESLSKFLAAYSELLDHLEKRTRRIVLVAPAPFFEIGPAASLAKQRNEVLGEFVDGIEAMAMERDLVFVDTFLPMLESAGDASLSANGTHLSETGLHQFSSLLAGALGALSDPNALTAPSFDSLRQSIRRKNRLWQQYYHPTNWAFLFGDRQHVPASRDHEDTRKRWFIREVDALPPLIAETEADIHRYAREAAKP